MTLATWHFHIEISSKCTLRCPRCPRQEISTGLVNTELNLEFFKRNFTPEFIKKSVEKITFCGNDGDPIYAHDLVPVIRYIKSVKPVQIVIVTNGSYKKSDWWQELGSMLTSCDQVHFSLDGWDQDSNSQYRVNSDWKSIVEGINALRANSDCQMIWAAIAFKFNEQNISTMQELATKFGFDKFHLTMSSKFAKIYNSYGPDDVLQPSDQFISQSSRYERVVTDLSQKVFVDPTRHLALTYFSKSQVQKNIRPLCTVGTKGLYIDATGHLYPCCWVASRYAHNQDWKNNAFNLNTTTLSKCLYDLWMSTYTNFYQEECQSKCNPEIVDKDYYAIEW